MIWLGMAHVDFTEWGSEVAYVQVACKANSKEHFVGLIKDSFDWQEMKMLDIELIHNQTNLEIEDIAYDEGLDLIERVIAGEEFCWGRFLTFD